MDDNIVDGLNGFKSLVVDKSCPDPTIESIFFLLSEDQRPNAAHFLWKYHPELISRIIQRLALQNWHHALFLASEISS